MSTPGDPRQQSSGESDRWAPFPVQDWSTMPGPQPTDGTGRAPSGEVDPGDGAREPNRVPRWTPPDPGAGASVVVRERRPRWLPLLAVLMVTVLVAAGLILAERLGAPSGRTAAARFLPADGAVSYQLHDTTIGNASTTSTHVEESARHSGALVIGGLDYALGSAVLRVVGLAHLDRMAFWRTTGTMIGNLGNGQQHIRVYRVDGAVALVAETSLNGADVYSPALLELPDEVTAGDTWSTEGSVGTRHYRSEFRAVAAEPGCLRVVGTVVESAANGQAAASRQTAKTWCEGRGVTAEETVRGKVVSRVATTSRPATDPTLRTADERWTWKDPAGWRRRDYDLMSSDASLGSGRMTGATSQVPPVMTDSGLVFRTTSGDDLVATTPKTVDRWTSLWRMHPGGTVLSVAAFGDVVVATTSRRQVVGYSDAGVRLWFVDLDDVAFWPPVPAGAGRIAVGDAAGTVRLLDVLSGTEIWRHRVGAQLGAPLAATSGSVVVLDAGGTTTALAADTGEQRWSTDLHGAHAAVVGETVVVHNQATLEGLDLQTGRRRWLLPRTGTLTALESYGDVVLAATQLGTVAVDESGAIVRELPAYERLTVVGDVVVGWGTTTAELRRRDWTVLTTIDTPDATLARALPPTLAYRQGVMVFGKAWTFTTWSDEP